MTELKTTVVAVAVYPDRARVTRSGTVVLEAGEHRLEILELPLKLDAASVRASARGTARARLFGVDVRRDFYAETPAERVRELEERIESLEDEIRGLDSRTEMLKREQTVLGELSGQTEVYARGLAYGRIGVEDHMRLLDGVRGRAEELDAALFDLTVRRRALERHLEKHQQELRQLRGARGRERYAATIEVEVVRAGDLTVELTYVVSDAGWQPFYDMRLIEPGSQPAAGVADSATDRADDLPTRTLEVGYLAQVTQRTGEDWSDVSLTLSTARPALAGTIPELKPWYVGPIVAHRPGVARSVAKARLTPAPAPTLAAADMTFALAEPEPEAEKVEAEVVMAAVETAGATVTYKVLGSASVPADGAPHKVAVGRFELDPELDYVAAAKLVEAAYRRAKVPNDSPYTLLPGRANLFAGDEFIGITDLEMIAPGGELELYLGTDDRVRIERELKRQEVDKRLIGDRRRLRYGFEITVENLLPMEAKVTLHDQIPVPRHEDIKVRLESAEPAPTDQTELNLLTWELTLEPGEERVVRFDFAVEHPRAMRLMGLGGSSE